MNAFSEHQYILIRQDFFRDRKHRKLKKSLFRTISRFTPVSAILFRLCRFCYRKTECTFPFRVRVKSYMCMHKTLKYSWHSLKISSLFFQSIKQTLLHGVYDCNKTMKVNIFKEKLISILLYVIFIRLVFMHCVYYKKNITDSQRSRS